MIEQGVWSQYLEVGIGPDAEIFTKAPPMAAVGTGHDAGIHPISTWNNPEPEVVLAVSSAGKIVGATLGNDVNLRDVEGRSALLLGKAKDNNASAAIGPFLRLFDSTFSLDHVRRTEVTLTVEGDDGFMLSGSSSIAKISRDPADLVAQMIGPNHQYPDGAVLYLGHDVRARGRIAMRPARASPTRSATSSPSPRRSSAPSPTASSDATRRRRGPSAPAI